MSNFQLEVYLTPQNKNGKWGKRVKHVKVSGFDTKYDAVVAQQSTIKHLCKLSSAKTNTFFVETFILNNGSYVDCETGVCVYDREKNEISIDAA